MPERQRRPPGATASAQTCLRQRPVPQRDAGYGLHRIWNRFTQLLAELFHRCSKIKFERVLLACSSKVA
ncbi:hypothetical protein, partial [Klebsiella pneumoniae]|uniref:hypothetical protein n=1 Tax=Klebsiella pneumoniae TaxID=573 RepID=UPI0039C30B4A